LNPSFDVSILRAQGISDIICIPGQVNVDFADVRAVMAGSGTAMLGMGAAAGPDRGREAALVRGHQLLAPEQHIAGHFVSGRDAVAARLDVAHLGGNVSMTFQSSAGGQRIKQAARVQNAIHAPLVERSLTGARGVVYTVAGGADLSLSDLSAAAAVIDELAAPDANIIFGTVTDASLQGELHVTVIATGFGDDGKGSPETGLDGATAQNGVSGGDAQQQGSRRPRRHIGNPFARNGALRIV
jgi:cell division GTPase FtsZ